MAMERALMRLVRAQALRASSSIGVLQVRFDGDLGCPRGLEAFFFFSFQF